MRPQRAAGKWVRVSHKGRQHLIYRPELDAHVCIAACPCDPTLYDTGNGKSSGTIVMHHRYTAAWHPAREH